MRAGTTKRNAKKYLFHTNPPAPGLDTSLYKSSHKRQKQSKLNQTKPNQSQIQPNRAEQESQKNKKSKANCQASEIN